jgi:type I restriction enzyme S subunit
MSNSVPEGWAVKPLSELATVDRESLKNSTQPDYRFHYIDIASIKTGRVDVSSKTIAYADAPSRARKVVRKGDVLMSTVRPNLQAFAYFDREGDNFVASTGFAVISAKKTSDGEFLYQSILADEVTRQIAALVAGSNYPAISSSNVKNIELVAPPLPEQQKIATILTSVDNVIETTRAQINKLKDLKTGMMQALLTKGIGSGGVPHTEFKDSPVGRIPAGWDVLPLDHLVKVNKPITYGIVQAGPHCEGGVPYIRVSDMTERTLTLKNMLRTSPETAEKYKRSAVVAGDIVYALRGVIGHVQLVPSELEGANLTQGTARISPNDQIAARYLFWAMKAPYVQHQNELEAKGSTFREVTLASLRKIAIIVPPINEQHQMASNMDSIKLKLAATEDKLTQLQSLKKALMQDLLTGKVRVKIDEKEQEPAVA